MCASLSYNQQQECQRVSWWARAFGDKTVIREKVELHTIHKPGGLLVCVSLHVWGLAF